LGVRYKAIAARKALASRPGRKMSTDPTKFSVGIDRAYANAKLRLARIKPPAREGMDTDAAELLHTVLEHPGSTRREEAEFEGVTAKSTGTDVQSKWIRLRCDRETLTTDVILAANILRPRNVPWKWNEYATINPIKGTNDYMIVLREM